METSTDSPSAVDGEVSRGSKSDGTTGTRRKLSDQQEAEVTRLYAETDTPVSEISKRFGIGESSVYRVAQRHGAALRGRTATSGTPKPRAVAPAAAPAPVAATPTPGTRGRGRAAGGARAATTPSGNGRRTGARAARGTGARRTPAAATATTTPAAAPRATASATQREFRVSYVAVRVFAAVDMADAILQAEAAGATDITGIVRND